MDLQASEIIATTKILRKAATTWVWKWSVNCHKSLNRADSEKMVLQLCDTNSLATRPISTNEVGRTKMKSFFFQICLSPTNEEILKPVEHEKPKTGWG